MKEGALKLMMKRMLTILSITGLVLFNYVTPVLATEATSKSDLLSDSRPTVAANHTLTFTIQDSWDASDTITVDFADTFGTTGFANSDDNDFDVRDDGVDVIVVASGGCAANRIEITTVNTTTDTFTFTLCSGSTAIATGSEIEIQIGTHATESGTGDTQITNPSKVAAAGTADILTISLGGTAGVTGDILAAIQDGVTLSATVDETLTFTVAGRTTGDCNTQVTGGNEPAAATATTLPFGTISSDTFYNICQSVTIGTNASGGYSTTLESITLPTSGTDTILQGDCDGACSITTSAPWDTAASNNGYAYCMVDNTGNGAETADGTEWTAAQQCAGGSQAFKLVPNRAGPQAAQPIMASAGATASNDVSYVGYRLNIGSGQAAGTYQAVFVYNTTPTF